MNQITLLFAGFFGMFAVILGAFGAHVLNKFLSEELLKSFETGVKYQIYHAIVLLLLAFHLDFTTALDNYIVYSFILGIFLFSFSIYGLLLSASKGKKLKFLGPITPLGGIFLIIGWGLLIYKATCF